MSPFERITKYIYDKTRGTDLSLLTLENIQSIIEYRNDIIGEFGTGWIDWDLLGKKGKVGKDEREFKKEIYDIIKLNALYNNLTIIDDELDKLFMIEMEIVGNKEVNYYNTTYLSAMTGKPIPFEEMEFRKKYRFNKWTDWQDTIDDAAEDFYEDFDLFPNQLYANKHSHSQINFIVNNVPGLKDNTWLVDKETKMIMPVDKDEEVVIGNYENEYCKVKFYFDESLKDKVFILEYTDDQDDDEDGDDDDDDDGDDDVEVPTPVDLGEILNA